MQKLPKSDLFTQKRDKLAGCLHDKDHINLPRKSHLLLFLYDLWHKNLQFVLKVNIKSGKQYYKVIWYLAWSEPANFPCFCVKNAVFETLLQPCLNTFRIGGLCETCINSQIYPHLLLVLIIPGFSSFLFFGIILFYLVPELYSLSLDNWCGMIMRNIFQVPFDKLIVLSSSNTGTKPYLSP